jgi:hypothetical protein
VMPDIDSTLVGFRVEKLFEYSETGQHILTGAMEKLYRSTVTR